MIFPLLLGLAAGCAPAPEALGEPATCLRPADPPHDDHPLAEALSHALDEAVADGLPGLVMAIQDADGQWEGSAGRADLGRDTPMETCHRTRIASVTKPFIATAVMLLAEEGSLDLDGVVSDYLPEERGRLPFADAITLRQLLNHTSGVRNFLDVGFVLDLFNDPARTWTLEECYEGILDNDADFAPGEGWSYSNTNYLLLARIIEAATGSPHEVVLRERLFEPLGMTDTTYAPDVFDHDGVVHGYFDLMGDRRLVDATDTYANTCVGPDGGIISSARDLLTFGSHLFAERDLLSEAALAQMSPDIPTGYEAFPLYGHGLESWDEDGAQGMGHGGHEFGYRTWLYHFEEQGLTFVLWINASSLQPTEQNIAGVIDAHRKKLRDIALRIRT